MSTTSTPERRAAFAAAGLPVPIYDGRRIQTEENRTWNAIIGTATHAVIASVAAQAQDLPADHRAALLAGAVPALVTDRRLGRLDRARLRVSGLAASYLTRYLPPAGVNFLGAELPVASGRVDLCWSHPQVGVWFDEVKTWRRATTSWDETTWAQVRRYLRGGADLHGDAFAGVRVLTLGNNPSCAWVSPAGAVSDLHGSPLAPHSLAAVVGAA